MSIVSKLGLALSGRKELVALSTVVKVRQLLGADAIKQVFEQSQQMWKLMRTILHGAGYHYWRLMVSFGAQQIPLKINTHSPRGKSVW